MTQPPRSLTPAQASAALGVSAKALRLYEQHGLLEPDRTETGWRVYDVKTMERASEIVALRGLGLSLAQVGRVLSGNPCDLDAALSAHEAQLHEQARDIARSAERLRAIRADIARGNRPSPARLVEALSREQPLAVGFPLPWPWNGEWFALQDIPRLGFITGPLGSGKTRFARALSEAIADAEFVALDRLHDQALRRRFGDDAAFADRVEQRLAWLSDEGAERSDALIALIAALENATASVLVVDMIEDGLSASAQAALVAHLRLCGTGKRALMAMTRSTSILDPGALVPDETIIMCSANHSPPFQVMPYPGGKGHETLETCLAAPEVRARTAGVVAARKSFDVLTMAETVEFDAPRAEIALRQAPLE